MIFYTGLILCALCGTLLGMLLMALLSMAADHSRQEQDLADRIESGRFWE